ncbi:hypothetical protein GGI20_001950 [Coemansia sp. BCRC 34301]|nr:hypothetical protein GGI20_001950 [Coemansia sp. BCRC 34301]
MTKSGGHRRPRHRSQNKAQDRPPGAALAEHSQTVASQPHEPSVAADTECAVVTRELADTLYAELGQILQREYGKTSEQIQSLAACSESSTSSSAVDRVPVLRDGSADKHETHNPAGDTDSSQEALKTLEEENRRLREQLAERDAEQQGLQQRISAHRQEIEVARRHTAHLDATVARQAEADLGRPMTAPELRAALRGLYRQYTLREEHFIAVERTASLESKLWMEKYMRAEAREHTHLDDLESLRKRLEEAEIQRSAQERNAGLLRLLRGYGAETRRRLGQCQTLVRAVASEAPVLRAEYVDKLQCFSQELWTKSRERADMDSKLRAVQSENQRLDEAWRELQAKWQQQAWELHNSKQVLEDKMREESNGALLASAMRDTVAVFFGSGAGTGESAQSSLSPPRAIRMPRRTPRHLSAHHAAGSLVSSTPVATESNGGNQLHSLLDQRDSAGAPSEQARFHLPSSSEFTFSLPLSAE